MTKILNQRAGRLFVLLVLALATVSGWISLPPPAGAQSGLDFNSSGSPELDALLRRIAQARSQSDYLSIARIAPEAISASQRELSKNHAITSALVNMLGKAYKELGRFVEAESAYREALTMRRIEPGPNHPDVAETLNNLGVLYELWGRWPEALFLHRDALVIRQAWQGLPVWIVAQSLHNIGSVLARTGQLREAAGHFHHVLSSVRGFTANDYNIRVSSIEHLIVLYTAEGRFNEVAQLRTSLQGERAALANMREGRTVSATAPSVPHRVGAPQKVDGHAAMSPSPRSVTVAPKRSADPLQEAKRLLADAQSRLAFLGGARSDFSSPPAWEGAKTRITPNQTGRFLVMVEDIPSASESQRLAQRLRESGIAARQEPHPNRAKGWRLLLGHFDKESLAIDIATEATRVTGRSTSVVFR